MEKMTYNEYLIKELKDYLPGNNFTEDLKKVYEYMQAFYNLDSKEMKKQYIYLWNCYFDDKEIFKNEVEKIKSFVKARS